MSRLILRNIAVLLLAALLLTSIASAFGLAPGNVDLIFEPGAEHIVKLKLLNPERQEMQVMLHAQGELSQYISFDQSSIYLSSKEAEKYAYYTLKLPQKLERQGPYSTNIVVISMPVSKSSTGMDMSANIAIISKLNLMVPYSGKYAEITLFSPAFEEGKANSFAVEVRNLGTQDILSGQLVIDIFGPTNTKISTVSGTEFQLASKQNKIETIEWLPDIGPGNYRAVATLLYDGENTKDEKTFAIGEYAIEIADITVRDFTLGGIAMFDILLENRWNERIPGIYGIIEVRDESGKTYTQFKTASTDIDSGGKGSIQAYWDTKKVGPGKYKLDIVLNYLGKQSEKIFDIMVSTDKIETNLGGMAVKEIDSEKEPLLRGIYIVIFLLIVMIIINVFIFLRRSKPKK